MTSTAIEPGATLGVMGGGQLGRMFVHAAQRMGYFTAVLDPDATALLQTLLAEREGLERSGELIAGALSQLREKVINEDIHELQRQKRFARDSEKDDLLMAISRLNAERRALGGRRWNVGAESAQAD